MSALQFWSDLLIHVRQFESKLQISDRWGLGKWSG
jgi:hypothetical protein